MRFEWETKQERLLRYMQISPKEKLEWLHEMNNWSDKASSKKTMKIRQQLRQRRVK